MNKYLFPKQEKEAVVYCRVSAPQQVKGHSLMRQVETCVDWARRNGYYVSSIFSEIGSAYPPNMKEQSLPVLKQAARAARIRKASLIFEHWDRVSRGVKLPDAPELISVFDDSEYDSNHNSKFTINPHYLQTLHS